MSLVVRRSAWIVRKYNRLLSRESKELVTMATIHPPGCVCTRLMSGNSTSLTGAIAAAASKGPDISEMLMDIKKSKKWKFDYQNKLINAEENL